MLRMRVKKVMTNWNVDKTVNHTWMVKKTMAGIRKSVSALLWRTGIAESLSTRVDYIASYPEMYGLFVFETSEAIKLIKASPKL